jgi:hypothetical protein
MVHSYVIYGGKLLWAISGSGDLASSPQKKAPIVSEGENDQGVKSTER